MDDESSFGRSSSPYDAGRSGRKPSDVRCANRIELARPLDRRYRGDGGRRSSSPARRRPFRPPVVPHVDDGSVAYRIGRHKSPRSCAKSRRESCVLSACVKVVHLSGPHAAYLVSPVQDGESILAAASRDYCSLLAEAEQTHFGHSRPSRSSAVRVLVGGPSKRPRRTCHGERTTGMDCR